MLSYGLKDKLKCTGFEDEGFKHYNNIYHVSKAYGETEDTSLYCAPWKNIKLYFKGNKNSSSKLLLSTFSLPPFNIQKMD